MFANQSLLNCTAAQHCYRAHCHSLESSPSRLIRCVSSRWAYARRDQLNTFHVAHAPICAVKRSLTKTTAQLVACRIHAQVVQSNVSLAPTPRVLASHGIARARLTSCWLLHPLHATCSKLDATTGAARVECLPVVMQHTATSVTCSTVSSYVVVPRAPTVVRGRHAPRRRLNNDT